MRVLNLSYNFTVVFSKRYVYDFKAVGCASHKAAHVSLVNILLLFCTYVVRLGIRRENYFGMVDNLLLLFENIR